MLVYLAVPVRFLFSLCTHYGFIYFFGEFFQTAFADFWYGKKNLSYYSGHNFLEHILNIILCILYTDHLFLFALCARRHQLHNSVVLLSDAGRDENFLDSIHFYSCPYLFQLSIIVLTPPLLTFTFIYFAMLFFFQSVVGSLVEPAS